jgi:hypothetical protein
MSSGNLRIVLSVLLMAAGVIGAAVPAAADTLVWRFKSEHPNTVSLSFYSQDRNHAWPGGDEVYIIDDWDTTITAWTAARAR